MTSRSRLIIWFLTGAVLTALPQGLQASSGTEAASFLDIPVGAGPASMGAAYSALATDAYAPVWNPAGLSSLDSFQIATQYVSYVQNTNYEFISFGAPLPAPRSCSSLWCGASGLGGSIQYFGSGQIAGLDTMGNPTGTYSAYYAAYNLAYGRSFGDQLSLGLTGKIVQAELASVSAHAYAMDLGSLYKYKDNLQFAATLVNIGSDMTFLSQGDPLPLAMHLGAAYQPLPTWNFALEGVFPRTGLEGLHLGGEWDVIPAVSLRSGFRTETLKGQEPLAGYSLGIGIHLWGQEFSYAWVPYGDLGSSYYFSLLMKFGERAESRRNLITIGHPKSQRAEGPGAHIRESSQPDYDPEWLLNIISDSPKK